MKQVSLYRISTLYEQTICEQVLSCWVVMIIPINSSPSEPAHFFVRDDVSTRIALVFVRSKWTKWSWFHLVHFDLMKTRAILVKTSSLTKKCAGAEGEELVLDYLWVYEHCLSSRGKIAVGRMPSNEGWEQIECTVKNVNQVTWAPFTCPLLALYSLGQWNWVADVID